MNPNHEGMFDLHCHSRFSDGDCSPTEVARQVKRAGLEGAVLTDHNTHEGYGEFHAESERLGLKTFMGVEISTSYKEINIHILGYARHFSGEIFHALLSRVRQGYLNRADRMVEKLQDAHLTKLTLSDMQSLLHKEGEKHTVTKYDIAMALAYEQHLPLERIKEVQQHVEKGGVGYEPYGPWAVHPLEAVRAIKEADGMPVIAHPLDFMKRSSEGNYEKGLQKMTSLLSILVENGLQGMEVSCSVHDKDQELLARSLAGRYHLYPTAGTDWHGPYHHPQRQFGQRGISTEDFHQLLTLL